MAVSEEIYTSRGCSSVEDQGLQMRGIFVSEKNGVTATPRGYRTVHVNG